MKKIRFFKNIVLLFSLFLLLGCTRSDERQNEGNEAQTSQKQGANASANDPRWRNELFQNGVETIRDRAGYENPEQYLNSLNQVVGRFNSWIQSRSPIEGWKTDPLVSREIEVLDALESVRTELDAVFVQFRSAPEGAALSADEKQKIQHLAESLKTLIAPIDSKLPAGMQLLARNLQHLREQLLSQLILNRVDENLKLNLEGFHLILAQMGILTGSRRLEFLPSGASNIPTAQGEAFVMAYENDSYTLFEQFLLQDVSRWAQGTVSTELEEVQVEQQRLSDTTGAQNQVTVAVEDVERMNAIFRWVTSNIDLRPEFSTPQLPLEILLSGEGTVLERAWICILLARQQELNAFLIEVPQSEKRVRYLIGFLYNDDISLYDPELGLPVFQIRENLQWEKGNLRVKPALWSEVCADPEILNDFWALAGLPKMTSAKNIQDSKVKVEASPWYLTMRFAILQDALKNGKNRVVMSLPPVEMRTDESASDGSASDEMLMGAYNAPSSVRSQILRKNAFQSVEAWEGPINSVIFRAFDSKSEMNRMRIFQKFCTPFPDGFCNLWRGRMLYLKGILTGPMSAAGYYQRARLSEAELEYNYQKAGPAMLDFYRECRYQASFYLSLISYMLDRPTAALDSYKRHVLGTNLSIYSDSARCHCGRMCELEEKWTEARDFYAAVQGPLKPQAAARAAILPIPAENTSNVSNVENVESSTLK